MQQSIITLAHHLATELYYSEWYSVEEEAWCVLDVEISLTKQL